MKASVAAITLAVLVAACGGSPTQPSPSQTPSSSSVPVTGPPPTPTDPPSPAPTPTPQPPTPSPQPPTPSPQPPAPAPAPAPAPNLRLDSVTDGAYWSDQSKALPATFAVAVWPERVQFGDRSLPRDTRTPEHMGIIASDGTDTFTLQRGQQANVWVWQFSGPAGHATGTAKER